MRRKRWSVPGGVVPPSLPRHKTRSGLGAWGERPGHRGGFWGAGVWGRPGGLMGKTTPVYKKGSSTRKTEGRGTGGAEGPSRVARTEEILFSGRHGPPDPLPVPAPVSDPTQETTVERLRTRVVSFPRRSWGVGPEDGVRRGVSGRRLGTFVRFVSVTKPRNERRGLL